MHTAERLLQACKHEDASLAKEVLNSGTFSEMDLRCQDESGNSPLMLASLFGNEKTVDLLLSHKVHVDSRNYKGQTALMLASEKGYDSIAEILLDHDANIDLKDDNKHTALTYAILGRHRKVVTILLSHGAQIDSKSQEMGENSQDENIQRAIVSRSTQSVVAMQVEGFMAGVFSALTNIVKNPNLASSLEKFQDNSEVASANNFNTVYFSWTDKIAGVPFLDHHLLECDSTGREWTNVDYDITVRIPEGAVDEGEKIHFEVGVALYGPFIFPDNTRPISCTNPLAVSSGEC